MKCYALLESEYQEFANNFNKNNDNIAKKIKSSKLSKNIEFLELLLYK